LSAHFTRLNQGGRYHSSGDTPGAVAAVAPGLVPTVSCLIANNTRNDLLVELGKFF